MKKAITFSGKARLEMYESLSGMWYYTIRLPEVTLQSKWFGTRKQAKDHASVTGDIIGKVLFWKNGRKVGL